MAASTAMALGCATTPRPVVAQQAPDMTTSTQPVVAAPPTQAKGIPFSATDFGFEIDKPASGDWALATNVTSPEGRSIPVVVAHPNSGAQIVIQVSEPVDSPRQLAGMLREKLNAEQSLALGQPEKLRMDSGSEAYGFTFAVKGEAKGRVAVISTGPEIVLVVASWPETADKQIVSDIDSVVRSVRASGATAKASVRPDKA